MSAPGELGPLRACVADFFGFAVACSPGEMLDSASGRAAAATATGKRVQRLHVGLRQADAFL